jgi:hypothetical protein
LAVGILVPSVLAQEVLDIGGYAYYSYYRIDTNYTEAYPVTGDDIVYHYKRTATGGWELFTDVDDNPVNTDVYGSYLFTNVNVDPADEDSLFENADWFKIKVDATDCIDDWSEELGWVRERYSYKEPRDSEWPDPDIIRVDVIYADNPATPPTGSPATAYRNFEGHFVRFIEGTGHMLNMATWPGLPTVFGNDVGCGNNVLAFGGCNEGHWWSHHDEDAAAILDEAGWAHYRFYKEAGEFPAKKKYADLYYYWDPEWPAWALHGAWEYPDVLIDVVDKVLP